MEGEWQLALVWLLQAVWQPSVLWGVTWFEPAEVMQVVTIGLFDGIGALRAAVDALGWNIIGHITVEKDDAAARVVESRFPNTIRVHDVTEISEEMVSSWALKFSQAALVLIGAGPPCQGVSGLNAARKGALRDARSNLFVHVSRVRFVGQTVISLGPGPHCDGISGVYG